MSTATVVFSGPALNPQGQNCAEFTTIFRPPSNISGRSCYLKITNLCCMARGSLGENVLIDDFNTYFLTCDLPQPCSSASINDVNGALEGTMINRQGKNRVVATFMSGGVVTTGSGSTPVYRPAEAMVLGPTRILVDIPNGPQTITFQLWKATEKMVDSLNNLTIMCEITPVDTGMASDIPI